MGNSASVNIWVGVKSETHDIDEVRGKLPRDMFDEDGDTPWGRSKKESILKYGFSVEEIYCGDEIEGLGDLIFSHSWNCGTAIFNPNNLSDKINKSSEVVKALFESCGIEGEVNCYIQTDYS